MRNVLALAAAVIVAAAPVALHARTPEQVDPEKIAAAALTAAPVWDGHNDVPWQLRERHRNMIAGFDFADTTDTAEPAKDRVAMHTDLARLRKGRVGAQFWSVYVPASMTDLQAVQAVMEQVDVTRRLVARYPGELQMATSAAEVERAMKAGKVASLLGIEGGAWGAGGAVTVAISTGTSGESAAGAGDSAGTGTAPSKSGRSGATEVPSRPRIVAPGRGRVPNTASASGRLRCVWCSWASSPPARSANVRSMLSERSISATSRGIASS